MKNILLDLGGVVFNSTGISNEQIDWPIISQLNHKHGHQLNIGEINAQVFLDEYNLLTNQKLSLEDFLKNIFDTLEFNEALVNFLSPKYNIYILSDNYRENIDYISKRYHFKDWSMGQFYSFDFKCTKYESPKIFDLVLEELNFHPNEVLFIDDSPQKIEHAMASGINSIRFENNKQFFEAFSHYLN